MTPSVDWLRWSSLVLFAGASLLTFYVVAATPSRASTRLGLRGLKRQRALARGGAWSSVEPFVRWLGVRASAVIGDRFHATLDRQLTMAGDYLGITPAEYVALTGLGAVTGFGAGLVFDRMTNGGAIVVISSLFLGAGCVYLTIASAAESRLKRISRGLPHAIDLMALGMSAGLDFHGAVRQLVEKSGDADDPLVEELSFMLQKMSLGNTRRQVLTEFAERAPVEVVREFVGAVVQAEERGHPVSRVLQIQATTSRERRSTVAEEKAARAGVALMIPLVLLFASIMLLLLAPTVIRLGHSGFFSS
ncbi:MAG TPA: type II secretion system F family protein [Polyangiaceae bacterium]|nr:type II secretion system F family protein [Polyangiaceae bacterium]